MVLDSLASYSSVFPGIEGQRAQSQEARVARILDPGRAKVVYGGPPPPVAALYWCSAFSTLPQSTWVLDTA